MKNSIVVLLTACLLETHTTEINISANGSGRKTHDEGEQRADMEAARIAGTFYFPNEQRQSASSYNFSSIAALLRDEGYDVFEPGDDWPIVLLEKDVAVPANELLPELINVSERGGGSHIIRSTWRNKTGETVVDYFYDKDTKPNRVLFQKATNSWATHTCIRFQRGTDKSCKEKVRKPSFCVGNFGGCWSFVGKATWGGKKTGLGKSQRLSVSGGCELDACIHEFGHGLGFQHQQSRPDRDYYMSVNWENFKISFSKKWEKRLKSTWAQGSICGKKQVFDIPTPYDFLSVLQYGSFSFVDPDIRLSFVTKDSKKQWMIDYHRDQGLGPSHYDLFVINKAYKCISTWTKVCSENGQTALKCLNYGYLEKNCKCKCPPGYSGDTCQTTSGSMYPLLEKAQCFVEWQYPGIIDIANLNLDFKKRSYANMNFNFMQFCTIVVDTQKNDMRPIIRLDPSELMVHRRQLIDLLHRQDFIAHVLPQMYLFDCRQFFKLFWTSDDSYRKRTECFSSIFNVGEKVTKNNMLSLRSKSQTASLYFNVRYKWSTPSIEFLEAAFKLKLHVTFENIPQKSLTKGNIFKIGPSTTGGVTYLPPTIPKELRFESTTPNIFGVPLPSIFRSDENPKLSFIGCLLILICVVFITFFLGVCISEHVHVKELLKAADRRAALKENRRSNNLLAAGWVRMRGVDVADEVRKERDERLASSNWLIRLFGLDESDTDSSEEAREKAAKRKKIAKKRQERKARTLAHKAEDSSSNSESDDNAKRRWKLLKKKGVASKAPKDRESSSDDSDNEVKDRRQSRWDHFQSTMAHKTHARQDKKEDSTSNDKASAKPGMSRSPYERVKLPPIHMKKYRPSQP